MNVTVLTDPVVFDSVDTPADPEVLSRVVDNVADADLAAPPVVLPDFHHKSNMEMPSSVAVATRATIRPTLTSASLNCGMALLAFDAERPGRAGIEEFYRNVRERYPYPARSRRELGVDDVVRCATEGSQFAAERFDVDPRELDRMEERGRIDLSPYGGADRLRRELPALAFHLARLRFGTVGPSNHFVELQEVEEVFDPHAAAVLGVGEGQMTLQYHAGGGVLTSEIGALFGRRKHSTRAIRTAMAVQKPLYHLATARSVTQMRERLSLWFRDGAPPVALHSDEGRRMMLAHSAAMNYGFAFRTATYATLRRLGRTLFGGSTGRLVVDSPHNSIYEEEVDGAPAVVHRHNSCRAYPAERMAGYDAFSRVGQAVLLPGTNRTSSYLCVAGDSAATSLHSACHGAGTVIDEFLRSGRSTLDPAGRRTLRYRYDDAPPQEVEHLDDHGVNAALAVLMEHGLVRPVARLRPFAVLN